MSGKGGISTFSDLNRSGAFTRPILAWSTTWSVKGVNQELGWCVVFTSRHNLNSRQFIVTMFENDALLVQTCHRGRRLQSIKRMHLVGIRPCIESEAAIYRHAGILRVRAGR